MGADKALLPFGPDNLLQLALQKARAVCSAPVIVGDLERYAAYGTVIEDRIPGCGPLGGIHAALCSANTESNLILSVDMPLMTSEFLLWLAQSAAAGDELAIVPETDGRPQPLCAVYKRALLPTVEQALQAGEFKVTDILRNAPTRFVSEAELRDAGFAPDIFCNINTPGEYEAAASHVSRIPLGVAKG
jgi:molybdopterin-guanine dinucleotide biosynthesis protein A